MHSSEHDGRLIPFGLIRIGTLKTARRPTRWRGPIGPCHATNLNHMVGSDGLSGVSAAKEPGVSLSFDSDSMASMHTMHGDVEGNYMAHAGKIQEGSSFLARSVPMLWTWNSKLKSDRSFSELAKLVFTSLSKGKRRTQICSLRTAYFFFFLYHQLQIHNRGFPFWGWNPCGGACPVNQGYPPPPQLRHQQQQNSGPSCLQYRHYLPPPQHSSLSPLPLVVSCTALTAFFSYSFFPFIKFCLTTGMAPCCLLYEYNHITRTTHLSLLIFNRP